jgi:hypothetical protein
MVSERIKGKLHQTNSSVIESTMASKSIPRSWTADDEDCQRLAARGQVQEFVYDPLIISSDLPTALYLAFLRALSTR